MMLYHLLKLVCFFLATFLTLSLTGRRRNWYYSEAAKWKNTYPTCAGSRQSPIDIKTADVKIYTTKAVTYSDWNVVRPNIKHYHSRDDHTTWYSNDNMIAQIKLDGISYQFIALKYHWGSHFSKGSEHSVDGRFHSGEMEMFFRNTKYKNFVAARAANHGLAVLSLFLNEDAKLAEDIAIMSSYKFKFERLLTEKTYNYTVTNSRHSLNEVLNKDMRVYRYKGSLTVPPCRENVEWVIVKKPLDVTTSFMEALRALKKSNGKPLQNNVRPRQPLNSRTVYDVKFSL